MPLHGMLVRSDGVEHDLVLETPHLKTVRIFEFSGTIAAYGLGAKRASGTRCQAGGCTAENMPPSNTDVGPQEISEKSGGSRSTSFPIDRSAPFARFGTLRAKQTLALRDVGVQPKISPCVYRCKHPEQRGLSRFYLRWRLRRGKRKG